MGVILGAYSNFVFSHIWLAWQLTSIVHEMDLGHSLLSNSFHEVRKVTQLKIKFLKSNLFLQIFCKNRKFEEQSCASVLPIVSTWTKNLPIHLLFSLIIKLNNKTWIILYLFIQLIIHLSVVWHDFPTLAGAQRSFDAEGNLLNHKFFYAEGNLLNHKFFLMLKETS